MWNRLPVKVTAPPLLALLKKLLQRLLFAAAYSERYMFSFYFVDVIARLMDL